MSTFSMNANTLSNQNVMQVWIFIPWCKCFLQRYKCSYDAHVSLPILGCKFPWCKCPIMEMQMRLLYDANFPCRDVNAKFVYNDANAPLRRCRCKLLFFDIKSPLWVCHDVNAFLWVCHNANAFLLDANAIYLKKNYFSNRCFLRA